MRRALFALALVAAPLAAEPGLPDAAEVAIALDNHPSVIAARARVEAARADARARGVGPHEVVVSGSYVRRDVDEVGGFDEYDAQIGRAFRLPGKAALDREIGALGIAQAENEAEDARHQAALLLLGHWVDWQGAAEEARVDAQAVANYERALAAVRRRVELRDAAQLEADRTAAALDTARVLAEQSAGRTRLARARLAAHFPALALPADAPALPPPGLPEPGLAELHALVLVNSHEIAAAEANANRMETLAERSRRERIADPTLGLRLFSERGGEEKGAGVVLSMPLGGSYRRSLADQAAAEASAARSEAQLARYEVRETADADLVEAEYRLAAWQRARAGLASHLEALGRLRRGYELGEIDLDDLLVNERVVHDAFRLEIAARTEAARAIEKIRIDSHRLWLADDH